MWVHCLTQGDISASGFHLGSLNFSEPKENTTLQSCPTPWDSMDCSSLDSSVLGILQARILKCVAVFLVLWQEKENFPLSFYLICCAVGHPWVKVG